MNQIARRWIMEGRGKSDHGRQTTDDGKGKKPCGVRSDQGRWVMAILIGWLMMTFSGAQAQDEVPVLSDRVPPPFSLPVGEGLFRVASAEPLGRGGVSFRFVNEAYQISVHRVGEGTSVTGHLGLAYGLSNNVDIGISVPLLFDVAGGLAKYGTGDIVSSMKFGFPSRYPAPVYFGFDVSMVHPYGYKGRQALNVRPYSRSSREISSRMMFDLNKDAVGFRINGGYLISSGTRDPGWMYGGAVEVGRGQVFTVTMEYMSEPNILGEQTQRAILGARMNLWRLKLEAGLEKGLSDDLPSVTAIAGLRLNPRLGAGRKPASTELVRVPKDDKTLIRVAVVNLAGFEHERVGELVAQEIKTSLGRYANIRLVDVGAGTVFLDPDAAMRLAQSSNADVVITGRVLRYEMERGNRANVPLVVGLPQTRAHVAADIRIVDRRENGKTMSFSLTGTGTQGRGLRMFPTSQDDKTSYLSVMEKQRVWTDAIQQMLTHFFTGLRENFAWFPG